MFRIARTLSIAVLTTVLIALTAGCGGGAGFTPAVGGSGDAESGSLSLRITRSDLGLPPAGRAEDESPSVSVALTADGQPTVAPAPQALTGDAVEFQIPGLAPAVWTVTVTVTVGEMVWASGQTTATVERGQNTQVFVPLVTAAPTPTAGSVTLGVGALVNVPNGTEIRVGTDQEWVVWAPSAYVYGIAQFPEMRADCRLRVRFVRPDGTVMAWQGQTVAEYVSADGSDPHLEEGQGSGQTVAVWMKAGDRLTLRWPQITYGFGEVTLEIQRGMAHSDFGGEFFSADMGSAVKYTYPILR